MKHMSLRSLWFDGSNDLNFVKFQSVKVEIMTSVTLVLNLHTLFLLSNWDLAFGQVIFSELCVTKMLHRLSWGRGWWVLSVEPLCNLCVTLIQHFISSISFLKLLWYFSQLLLISNYICKTHILSYVWILAGITTFVTV